MRWQFRGSVYYLGQQAKRLAIDPTLAHVARHNHEIYRLATLLSQLSHRHQSKVEAAKTLIVEPGAPLFHAPEMKGIRATLNDCENEVRKLFVLASAGDAMLDEAYAAFAEARPSRVFEMLSDLDVCTPPREVAAAGATGESSDGSGE